jgi:hypothetical protein
VVLQGDVQQPKHQATHWDHCTHGVRMQSWVLGSLSITQPWEIRLTGSPKPDPTQDHDMISGASRGVLPSHTSGRLMTVKMSSSPNASLTPGLSSRTDCVSQAQQWRRNGVQHTVG